MKTTPALLKMEFYVDAAVVTEIKKGVFVVPTAVRISYCYNEVSNRWKLRSVEAYQDSDLVLDHSLTNVELDEWYHVSSDVAPLWLKSLVVSNFPAERGDWS